MKEAIEKYKDIINMSHHVSNKHPQMSLYERSAQFAPFSALTGYEDIIIEEGRLTDDKIEINEEQKFLLDNKLRILMEKIEQEPVISITYFIKDERKSGGKYITTEEHIRKIDTMKHVIVTASGLDICIEDIIDMQGKIFNELELN